MSSQNIESPVPAQQEAKRVSPNPDDDGESTGQGVMTVNTDGVAMTRKSKADTARLEPLFMETAAADFRSRWDEVQRGFVDDPQRAVRSGDELVNQVIQSLATSFAEQRKQLEAELDEPQASTESLRVALRRYRSFFERLLAI